MRRFAILLAACATASCMTPATMTPMTAADYRAALANRSTADLERDPARKPAELLAFAQIRPGDIVGDYIMGGGYFTRVLSAAVGPVGRVYAFQPNEFIAYRSDYAKEQDETVVALANAKGVRGPGAAPPFLEPLDALVTVQNFHDLFLAAGPPGTPQKAAAALHAALKPGGTLVVVDHAALPGSGRETADRLHRIDRAMVMDVLTGAGFALEAESALFANPDDPRTALVFDPAIRGRTDQFTLRFRKPR